MGIGIATRKNRPVETHNGSGGSYAPESVTRRFKWEEIEVFPGNPILDTRLKQMAKRWGGFVPQIVGIPLVADNTAGAFPEYGPAAIVMVNGHHRQELAIRHNHGGDDVICELLRGCTREELHKIFRQVNDARSINHAEKFLHRVGQKETKALKIVELLELEGYAPSTSVGAKDTIHSTGSLEWIYDGGDKALQRMRGPGPHRVPLAQTLFAYRALTPPRFTKQGAMLKGLGAFFLRYPESDMERFLEQLQKKYANAEKLLGAATQAKKDHYGSNNYEAFGFIARMAYNGTRRGKHTLPEWRS